VSTGHLHGEKKSAAELYQMLGEGDTNELYARHVKLDMTCDVPYGGGSSVDGKTVYIDYWLYREVKDGKVTVKGMSADQVIQAWIEHEHCEWAVEAGDNPVDAYGGAHSYATAKEERFVDSLGVNPERYEEAIRPALIRCQARDPKQLPKDLWCGPYLDNPTPRDKELLRIFRAKGVVDAFKKSKLESEYGIGAEQCRDCKYFGGGKVAPCEKVSGLVRWNRRCDWYEPKGK
jgi:hypothetical protein